jgi:hypothetical protein
MIKWNKFNLFLLTVTAMPLTAAAAETLCTPTEKIYFSCKIKSSEKLLSVCGRVGVKSGLAGDPHDYLQYRFGRLGHPELVYPKITENSLSNFKVEYDYRKTAGTSSFELIFNISTYQYRVYATNYPLGEGEDSGFDTLGGVRIVNSKGVSTDILCSKAPTSLLGELHGLR